MNLLFLLCEFLQAAISRIENTENEIEPIQISLHNTCHSSSTEIRLQLKKFSSGRCCFIPSFISHVALIQDNDADTWY